MNERKRILTTAFFTTAAILSACGGETKSDAKSSFPSLTIVPSTPSPTETHAANETQPTLISREYFKSIQEAASCGTTGSFNDNICFNNKIIAIFDWMTNVPRSNETINRLQQTAVAYRGCKDAKIKSVEETYTSPDEFHITKRVRLDFNKPCNAVSDGKTVLANGVLIELSREKSPQFGEYNNAWYATSLPVAVTLP